MYRVHILDSAAQELANLDKSIGRRIIKRINWLAENLDDVRRETLTGVLSGLYKLRVGDYRVLYEILPGEQIMVIHIIGHRREVYRKR